MTASLGNNAVLRDAIAAWLTRNGVDPGVVPADAAMSYDREGRALVTEVIVRGQDGRGVYDPATHDVARETREFPITVLPAGLVATWLGLTRPGR